VKRPDRDALVLGIDTGSDHPAVALASAGEVVAMRGSDGGRARGEEAAAWITELLAEAGSAVAELAAIGVITGPGSYTGLRIGLALARGLALVDSIPVVGVGSLELLAQAAAGGRRFDVCASMAGSREAVYAAAYRVSGEHRQTLIEPACEAPAAVVARLADMHGTWLLAGPAAAGLAEAAADAGLQWPVAAEMRPLSELVALAASVEVARGGGLPAREVLPVYAGDGRAKPNRNKVVWKSGSPPRVDK